MKTMIVSMLAVSCSIASLGIESEKHCAPFDIPPHNQPKALLGDITLEAGTKDRTQSPPGDIPKATPDE